MASNDTLCELFEEFRKALGDFIHQDDLMEVNLEFDLTDDFFRKDLKAMKQRLARMRECLETIDEGL